MGRDKALVLVDGVPLAVRVQRALHAAGADSVTAIGGNAPALVAAGLPTVSDEWPGEGPFGGVVQALRRAGTTDHVAVLSCDLRRPDADSLVHLVAELARTDADVVVPEVDGYGQWMHAVWNRRVAAILADVFAAGERSIVGATLGLRVVRIADLGPGVTADIDRPEDLFAAQGGGLRTIDPVDIPEIDIATLADKLAEGAPVFDVREPDEYEEAHAPGVLLVPLGQVADRVDEFPTDTPIFVICKSGGRSARAVEFLRANGVDATNVAGGTMAWIDAGQPVDTGA